MKKEREFRKNERELGKLFKGVGSELIRNRGDVKLKKKKN